MNLSFPGTAQHGEESQRVTAARRQEGKEGQVEKSSQPGRRRGRGQQWRQGKVSGHVNSLFPNYIIILVQSFALYRCCCTAVAGAYVEMGWVHIDIIIIIIAN